MVPGCRRFRACCNEGSWIVARNTRGGESKLGLGPVAYRLDLSASLDGCCDDGSRGAEDTVAAGNPRPRFVEADRGPDLCDWSDWTAIGCAARHRVRDLGGGVLVAWRRPLVHGRFALFRRFDEHARRIGADAATTLENDGRFGSS